MLARSDIRSDPASGVVEQGLPFRFAINVSEIQGGSCSPVAGAYVDVWHCNAMGVYSDVSAQGSLGKKFLRGYQVTDAHGNVRFLSIYPGYYPGRTVHVHYRIRKFVGTTTTFNFVSQLYFNDAITTAIFQREAPYNTRPTRTTTNSNDGIFNPLLMMRLADNNSHAIASFNAVINANPGIAAANVTPTDEDSIEHALDFGGGTPPLHLI
jgi:protocatechuate 3,4-dioxygenase beta subunit